MKTISALILIFLSFGLFLQTAFAQSDDQEQVQTDVIENIGQRFFTAYRDDNDKGMVAVSDEIFEKQLQLRFNENFQGIFFTGAAYAYWREDRLDKAAQCAENLIRHSSDYRQGIGYQIKFHLTRNSEDYAASYKALDDFLGVTMNESASEDAASLIITQRYISLFLRKLKSENGLRMHDLKFKTYEMLFDRVYQPDKVFSTMDYWRKAYSLGLLERGKIKQAKKMAVSITQPSVLRSMYVDKSYEKLWSVSSLKTTDRVMKAFDNDIDRLKRLVKKHPDKLQGRQSLIMAYATIGQLDKAENLSKKTLKEMEDFGSFSDEDDYKNWIFNEIAYVYYAKGDYERGNSYMVRAANTVEDSSNSNVSQVINYTVKLLDQGAYQKALDFQDKFMSEDGASDYGDMWIWYNEACGYFKLGQMKKSVAAMKKLADNREENYPAYSMSLLCAGKIEAAAQSYISRLNDPDHRSEALDAMQISKFSEQIMPLDKELRANLDKVRARADVRESVNKYGRIETWPLPNTYWGDF